MVTNPAIHLRSICLTWANIRSKNLKMVPKKFGVFARKYSRTLPKMTPNVFPKYFPKYFSIYSTDSVHLKVVSDCLVNKAITEKLTLVILLHWMMMYH